MLVPPATNALGVALICDLNDEVDGYSVGYNSTGDFVLSSLGNGDLDTPALNQQEGTLTSVDKRVVSTNVALPYGGYVLNDIANALGLNEKYTIDYTPYLPSNGGFKDIKFDDLPDYFDSIGNEFRGYLLDIKDCEEIINLDAVSTLPTYDGVVIYQNNSSTQFSAFTNISKQLTKSAILSGSTQFATVSKLKDEDKVKFVIDGVNYERVFKIDTSMKGTIAINPNFDMGLSSTLVSSYRFSQPKLEKMDS